MSVGVPMPPVLSSPGRAQGGTPGWLPSALPLTRWVLALAAFATLLHLAFSGRYGYFRDELYYAACGEHLAWGYLDHAPLAPAVAWFSRRLLGDSLFALRFFPALSAAAKVCLAGWMAREMGGARFAQFLAALAVLLAPIYLTFDNFLSMNAFEPVLWMACAAVFLRIRNGGSAKLWLLFGAVAGLGLLNKHSMLFFGSGLCAGLLLTSARRAFTARWIWLGATLALLIFLPNLLWEIRNGFPTISLLHAVIGTKYTLVAPWTFIAQQALLTHPLAAPLWLSGLWFLLGDSAERKYAALGWAYLVVLAEMIFLHGKIYYLAPAYPMLLAAGAVWVESRLLPRTGAWLKPAIVAPLLLGGFIAAPLAMPILPVAAAIKYCRFWDVEAVRVENVPLSELPQLFGDMFGWPEQVEAMARVYGSLSPDERAKAALLAYNYGEAGAIDYFGPRYGLPKAISGHNQYGLWGPRAYTGEVVVAIGYTAEELQPYFGDIRLAARISPRYAIPEESNLPIYLCRQPRKPLAAMWPSLRWLG
ncbi:MAG: glycosyltransferase family 39 protein [Acidobacteriia bacterium]|nr:glycosyltransferase family 39 protein [Terriglobia bacterium]